jgi:hypothetical protein
VYHIYEQAAASKKACCVTLLLPFFFFFLVAFRAFAGFLSFVSKIFTKDATTNIAKMIKKSVTFHISISLSLFCY